MNNLDKMKESICNQIKEMDAEKFYIFLREYEIDDEVGVNECFSLESILTCDKCRKLYGSSCNETDDKPCFERFKHYCEQE